MTSNYGKKTSRAGNVTLLVFSYLFLVLMSLVVLVPIFYIVTTAFDKTGDPMRPTFLPLLWSTRAFGDLFTTTDYLKWYLNTIIVGAINMGLVVVLVTPTAYAFSRMRFRGRKQFMMAFLVIQMFPGMSAMLAYYILLSLLNLINTLFGLALIFSCVAVPGSAFLVKGYLDTIPRSLEEAARLDGANRLQTILHILLPLALPMIGLIAIFGFAAPFGDYVVSALILRDPDMRTLAVGLQAFVSDPNKNYAVFAAGALFASIPMTILYIFLQKAIFKGLGNSIAGSKA